MMPDDLKKEIDSLKTLYNEEQSSLIRRLLKKSINEEKIELAVKMYIDEKISLGKASELAGISIWEMFDELKRRNIALKYKISDAELELNKILKKYEK
jgi:predicted HTH domain antitoxin